MFLTYVFGIFLLLVVACEFYTWKTGVPTVTSVPSVRRKMIEILDAAGAESFTILDLGSGTGKLALEIGKAFPAARVIGLEISIVPWALSRLRAWIWRARNVTFLREDFWKYDVSDVDAAVLYINGAIRDRMAAKLKAELKPGALVIMNETHLEGWDPIEVHGVGLLKVKVVVYRQG